MKKIVKFQIVFMFLAAICIMSSAHAEGWKKSYHAGTFDKNGNYMGGTNLMFLTVHKGKLYAATSMLGNRFDRSISISAQVLVKESATARWKLDYESGKQEPSVDALASITLSTDDKGNKLSQSVNLLIAGLAVDLVGSQPGAAKVAVRDDATNKWTTVNLMSIDKITDARAFSTHLDTVTGVDHVFVGISPLGIFSGVYDPAAPGQIKWNSTPELSDIKDRIMAFAECNGELYAAIRLSIYKLVDGLNPSWQKVYEYPGAQDSASGMRGLTAIPNPKGNGEVMLMGLEGLSAKIMYFDPSDNSVTTELDMDTFFKEQWGADWDKAKQNNWNYVFPVLDAVTPVTDPQTSEHTLLLGLYATKPSKPLASWYLIRHSNASYTLHEVPYIFDWRAFMRGLKGTRTIKVSPFASDKGQVVYMGGFMSSIKPEFHNTAWIYSADIGTVLGE
jgi:hypothetical protein